jgi:hypothetical protein
MKMYTLSNVSSLLTNASPTKVYTVQRIWDWCQKKGLRYEPIPSSVRGVSYKPVWLREDDLREFLQAKGFDTEKLFSTAG